jgi:acyl-CoA synthetase (AMP-forming)/AMP-acid ligase II
VSALIAIFIIAFFGAVIGGAVALALSNQLGGYQSPDIEGIVEQCYGMGHKQDHCQDDLDYRRIADELDAGVE